MIGTPNSVWAHQPSEGRTASLKPPYRNRLFTQKLILFSKRRYPFEAANHKKIIPDFRLKLICLWELFVSLTSCAEIKFWAELHFSQKYAQLFSIITKNCPTAN